MEKTNEDNKAKIKQTKAQTKQQQNRRIPCPSSAAETPEPPPLFPLPLRTLSGRRVGSNSATVDMDARPEQQITRTVTDPSARLLLLLGRPPDAEQPPRSAKLHVANREEATPAVQDSKNALA